MEVYTEQKNRCWNLIKRFIRDYAAEEINILHTLMFVHRFVNTDGGVVREMESYMMVFIIQMEPISESTTTV